MPETKRSPELQWVMRLAGEHPELFGDAIDGALELEEPQVSSHETGVYGVNGALLHVKFFGRPLGRTSVTYDPGQEMGSEYEMLREFERSGFTSGQHQVVRALGCNEKLDCALATLYTGGETLLSIIYGVIGRERPGDDLHDALGLTAGLLRKIHTHMPRSPRADGDEMFYAYLKSMLYLEEQGALDGFHRRVMKGLGRWYNHKPVFEQPGVTVHGDANPSNFKVYKDVVYGLDMERSRPERSPLLDVGTMVAELRHHFAYRAGDAGGAEAYVERFIRAYAPDAGERKYMAGMLPFYVSRGFFKIAMLGYWKRDYRRYLVEQGTQCIEVRP